MKVLSIALLFRQRWEQGRIRLVIFQGVCIHQRWYTPLLVLLC